MINEFWYWWQHLPWQINPVIFEISGFKVQYYGLMYLLAFGLSYFLVLYRIKNEKSFNIPAEHIENITSAMIAGVIIGGRLGYVIFYNPAYYFRHPLEIFLPFNFSNSISFTGISGMSYHGGLIGVIIATGIYVKHTGLNFWEIVDLYTPVIPLGYTFGRLGNFINGELYGRVTNAPFGMYFPLASGTELRHPSQLYEAFFEGIFLFAILWNLRKYIHTRGLMLAFYLIGYGSVRFCIEYFRQPDSHMGFVFLSFSAGQILCSVMILSGIGLYFYLLKYEKQKVYG